MEAGYDSDSDSGSDYLSFEESDDDEETKDEKEARERERRMVLEAAGLIVQVDGSVKPPASLVRARSLRKTEGLRVKTREVSEATVGPGPGGDTSLSDHEKEKKQRRAPPAVPVIPSTSAQPGDTVSDPITTDMSASGSVNVGLTTAPPRPPRRKSGKRSTSTTSPLKGLPPLPTNHTSISPPYSPVQTFDPDEHARQLDDAFERYESFRNAKLSGSHEGNRLSVISATSTDASSLHPPSSPTDRESVEGKE